MFLQRILLAALVAGVCFTSGCQQKPHADSTLDTASVQQARAVTSQPAWLHEHMPAHALAYLRVPSPWTLAGATPVGRPLDKAVAGKASLGIVKDLRAAASRPQPDFGRLAPLVDILFAKLDSPLEAVLIDPSGLPTPNAQVLLVARMDVGDKSGIDALFDALPQPSLHLAAPLDAAGDGALKMGARLHYDASSHRLFVLAGRQLASASQMASMLGSLGKAAVPPSMARLEPQIDASGQDLFAWVKLKGFAAAAASKLPMALAGALPGNLLEHADAVAFGTGSVDGHGRIRVAFSAPGARLLGYLAPKLDTDGLDAAGKLRWVFTLALPDADQLGQFEKSLNLNLGARGARTYRTLLARLKTAGVPGPHRLATLLGPELVSFGDAGGTYTALRVRDIDAFHAELANLARRHGWKTGVSRSGDARVHWLSAPSLLSAQARKNRSSAGDTMSRTLASIYMQRRVHLYWTEQGHWLVFAPVPQALADRAAIGAHTPVSGWLRKQDYPASTWMGATAISHGAQRDAYYHYIEALQFLGDMLDQPVDVMKLPSARALGLPADGVIAGGLTITPDTAGVQLDYQQSPGELLHGGHSTSTVAIVAILAAIAIPQYQDYVTKAKFSEAMTIADGLKTPVAEYAARHGRCPGNGEGGMAAPASYAGRYVASASVGGQAPHCTITARFKHAPAVPAALAGKRVVFTASRHANGTSWTCRAPAVADKYLPLACRQPR